MTTRTLRFIVATICLMLGVVWFVNSDGRRASDKAFGRYDRTVLPEASGLARSRKNVGVFWTHNDSGSAPILYATTARGRLLAEIELLGASSVDWEAVAADDRGSLYIADFGNNGNHRRNLSIHVISEPKIQSTADEVIRMAIPVHRSIQFRYPDQTAFPPKMRNYDAEALFWGPSPKLGRPTLFLLTKHRSDRRTKLYRFDSVDGQRDSQALTLVAETDLKGDLKGRGLVTGAAIHDDGRRIAVLTYYAIYIFQRSIKGDDYLAELLSTIELNLDEMKQVEAISWVGHSLFVSNEQAEIFLIDNPMKQVRFP
ncbi:MAG: hypothetical protein CMH52_01455 [Myxococcales bacterium]|nr:hypothetical protein [Myxococcales bacterium]|tara:strand:- start:784 stop:1722 length:939 start_codon:yes stop_codon:yes gene_type:complete